MAILFDDGFDTENSSFTAHWNGLQQKATGRITLVTSPVHGNTKAARFECRVGDNNVVGSTTGERAETYKASSAIGGGWGVEGSDQYIALSFYMESPYPYVPNTTWNSLAQWHASAGGTQACALDIYNGTIRAVTNGGANLTDKPFNSKTIETSLSTNTWYDWVIHAHWSSNAALGYFDVWMQKNGIVTGPIRVTGSNLYATDTGIVYPKIGIYRAAGASGTDVLYYGRYRIATTFAEATAAFPSWGGSGGTPPPTITPLPTLAGGKVRYGVTTAGSIPRSMSGDTKRGSPIAVTSAVSVDSIWIGVQGDNTGTQPFKALIYDATGTGGAPGTKLFESTQQSILSPFDPEWLQISVSPPLVLQAGTFHVQIISGTPASTNSYLSDAATGSLYYGGDTYSDGGSNPAGTMSLDNYRLTACLEGTPTSGFPTTPVLDNFNRADGAIGASWSAIQGTPTISVKSNAAIVGVPSNAINVATQYGTTDAALRAAVSAGISQSKPLYFNANTFHYNGIIDISGLTLFGEGQASLLIPDDHNNSALKITGTGGSVSFLQFIVSNALTGGDGGWGAAVWLFGATNGSVHHCTFTGTQGPPIFDEGSTGSRIYNNNIIQSMTGGIAFVAAASNAEVFYNTISNNSDDMISVVSDQVYPAICNNINIHDNIVSTQDHGRGIAVVGGTNIIVNNNSVTHAYGAGIYVVAEGNYNTYGNNGVTVSNNIVRSPDESNTHNANILVGSYLSTNSSTNITGSGNNLDRIKPGIGTIGNFSNVNIGWSYGN